MRVAEPPSQPVSQIFRDVYRTNSDQIIVTNFNQSQATRRCKTGRDVDLRCLPDLGSVIQRLVQYFRRKSRLPDSHLGIDQPAYHAV